MEARELEGFFWRPGDEAKTLGRLHLDDDGFRLTIERSSLSWSRQPPVLHGDCRGYAVTLFGGFTERISSQPFGTVLDFRTAVLGDHLPSLRTHRYRSVAAQVEHLDEFVGVSGLRLEATNNRASERQIVEWEPVPTPPVRLREVQIELRSAAAFDYVSDFEFRLRHGSWITFSSTTRKSLETWRNRWLGGLESLIALAMDGPTKVLHWTAQHGQSDEGTSQERTVEILMRARPNYGPRYPKMALWQPFFSLEDIDAKVATILRGFYRFRQRFPQPSELLFEYQVLAGTLTPPDRFLYMSRFLESFHRIKQSHSLGRSNNSFRNRLLALFSAEATAAAPWLGAAEEDMADLVVKTRNYYVHYNPEDQAKAVHNLELEELGDRLWQVVRACLLHEIGVRNDPIEWALNRDPLSARLKSTTQAMP